MAKANLYVKTDVEGRRLGKWRGLDTPVVQADNDECHRLDKNYVKLYNFIWSRL